MLRRTLIPAHEAGKADLSLKSGRREQLLRAIKAAGGNRRNAAGLLGVSRATLYQEAAAALTSEAAHVPRTKLSFVPSHFKFSNLYRIAITLSNLLSTLYSSSCCKYDIPGGGIVDDFVTPSSPWGTHENDKRIS